MQDYLASEKNCVCSNYSFDSPLGHKVRCHHSDPLGVRASNWKSSPRLRVPTGLGTPGPVHAPAHTFSLMHNLVLCQSPGSLTARLMYVTFQTSDQSLRISREARQTRWCLDSASNSDFELVNICVINPGEFLLWICVLFSCIAGWIIHLRVSTILKRSDSLLWNSSWFIRGLWSSNQATCRFTKLINQRKACDENSRTAENALYCWIYIHISLVPPPDALPAIFKELNEEGKGVLYTVCIMI